MLLIKESLCILNGFFRNYLPKLIIAFIAVVVISFLISWASLVLAGHLPSEYDSLQLLDLSVNSILVAVTIVYVYATWLILEKTDDSLKQNEKHIMLTLEQNEKSIRLTLNAQKHALLQKKLESFYYPLSDYLKVNAYIEGEEPSPVYNLNSISLGFFFANKNHTDVPLYNMIISHQYLAESGTKLLFTEFFRVLHDLYSVEDGRLMAAYKPLVRSLAEDIDEINHALESLMHFE